MLEVTSTAIPEVKLIVPARHSDARGFFSEVYSKKAFEAAGLGIDFVQDNHSFSAERGVIRGLHFQSSPYAQDKLVRVTRGAILDVAVDLRRGSATFKRHVKVRLSAEEWNQLFVPKGFAHGYCTLEANTEVLYKVSEYYHPECDRGIAWNDPELNIAWPFPPEDSILSHKDRGLPLLSEAGELFSV
jgi:dTDP-4-dehydrorhamnose 3,5-epimerase